MLTYTIFIYMTSLTYSCTPLQIAVRIRVDKTTTISQLPLPLSGYIR